MRSFSIAAVVLFSCFCFLFSPSSAISALPEPWQIGFQNPATEWMRRVIELHNDVMIILSVVLAVVFVLLFYTCYRFSAKRNPIPSKCSHNTVIEILWTLGPIIVIAFIAFPSLELLAYQEKIPESSLTLKITGHQWYWEYSYPGYDDLSFFSRIKDELEEGDHRLFEVDNRVVLPVKTNIRLLVTASDVIHSWGVPSFGVKQDAIPGRLNETWVNIEREGVYYGQCFELCGRLHGFMPIVVEAVDMKTFDYWINNTAKKKFA